MFDWLQYLRYLKKGSPRRTLQRAELAHITDENTLPASGYQPDSHSLQIKYLTYTEKPPFDESFLTAAEALTNGGVWNASEPNHRPDPGQRRSVALHQLPQEDHILYFPMPHPTQALILNHEARFRVVACGRRFGKTTIALFDLMLTALDGGAAWWVLPSYTMANETWQNLTTLLAPHAARIDKGTRTLYFDRGGTISVRSAHDPDKLRGIGLDLVVIDEAAFCDAETWHVLRPALSDTGGRALLLSTPNGRNWFWRLFQQGLNPDNLDWVAWHMPTWANPLIPMDEIQSAQREMPAQKFRQEYEAEFTDNIAGVFHQVRDCVGKIQPHLYEHLVMGIDWGRMHDYTAAVVMGADTLQVYDVVRMQDKSWKVQRHRLESLAKRWRVKTLIAEANSMGGPNVQSLREAGLPVQPFTMSAHSKPRLIDALAIALEDRLITLPDHEVLLAELEAYEMHRLPHGDYQYSAPSGGHDDTVIALALAYRATQFPTASIRKYA